MPTSPISQHPIYASTCTSSGSTTPDKATNSSSSTSLSSLASTYSLTSNFGYIKPKKRDAKVLLEEHFTIHRFIQDLEEDIVTCKTHLRDTKQKMLTLSHNDPEYADLNDVYLCFKRHGQTLWARRAKWIKRAKDVQRQRDVLNQGKLAMS